MNPEEIAFFSRLSQHWWDESGEFAMLHRMNPVRVGFIRQKIENVILDGAETERKGQNVLRAKGSKPLSGMKVLDVGCGGGLLSEVSHLCFSVTKR